MNVYMLSLALLALPIGLIAREIFKERARKQRKKALSLAYARLIREGKLSIEHAEVLGKKIVALNRINKKLLLVDHGNKHAQELCVPLTQIGSSKIIEVRDKAENCIKKIFLELKYKKIDKLVRFCFYDEREDSLDELKTLTRRAAHWKNRVDVHRLPANATANIEYVL